LQRIRTVAEQSFELDVIWSGSGPVYQRIAAAATLLERAGVSHRQIARKLGVAEKTVRRALAWAASVAVGT